MGNIRLWLLLIVAQILVMIALAVAGPATAAIPVLRDIGFACIAGIFLCFPPLLIILFLAAATRIGNGTLPMVQTIAAHQKTITIGVWLMVVVALVAALPKINGDIGSGLIVLPDSTTIAMTNATAPSSTVASSAMIDSGAVATSTDTAKVQTPGAGSATRTAILDALRQRLKMAGRFRVDHIRVYKHYAFVRATEVVELDKGELQETDMTVVALLELPVGSSNGWWRIVELWSLPDEHLHPMADFLRAVRARQRSEHLPAALFPDDLE